MLEKLQKVEEHFAEVEARLSDPSVVADVEKFTALTREHANLEPIIAKLREYKKISAQIDEDKNLLETSSDEDLKTLAAEELAELKKSKAALDVELPILLLPKDPNDYKNVVMEIRGGVGGEEAALFAGDLFRMYVRYAERQGWHIEIVDSSSTTIGGFKEIIFTVEGAGAFSKLKYESGIHRVQRVPVTESGGRIHTSAVTVAVMPEAEEVDVAINPADLRIDTYCASGAGGQYVNRTETAELSFNAKMKNLNLKIRKRRCVSCEPALKIWLFKNKTKLLPPTEKIKLAAATGAGESARIISRKGASLTTESD